MKRSLIEEIGVTGSLAARSYTATLIVDLD